jgi:hypothetical protein
MGRLSTAGFRTVCDFRRPEVRPLENSRQVYGLNYPVTLLRKLRSLGAARLVSTLPVCCFSGLVSGLPFKVSPNLSSSASPVSQASTQVLLKPAAYAIPPRPRAAVLLMIGHVAQCYTSASSSPVCVLRGSLEVIFFYLVYLSHDIDCNGVERCLDIHPPHS